MAVDPVVEKSFNADIAYYGITVTTCTSHRNRFSYISNHRHPELENHSPYLRSLDVAILRLVIINHLSLVKHDHDLYDDLRTLYVWT